MKKILLLTCCNLVVTFFASSQVVKHPIPYEKIEPLTRTYRGEKIKFVMARYTTNEIMVATKKHGYTLTKREAADAGIIPPLPEIKNFSIAGDVYNGIINIVDLNDFDRKSEKIVSDDGALYFNENVNQYWLQSNIPDTVVFFKVNISTGDTMGICKKVMLPLPENETMLPFISPGDIENKIVTPELLQQQKEMKISDGYTLVTTTVYFAGTNFKNVHTQSLSGKSLLPIAGLMDSCANGSVIVFDNVILKTPTGRLMYSMIPAVKVGELFKPFDFTGPKFQFGALTENRAPHDYFKRQKKIYISGSNEFVSAEVHFAGAGFPDPVTVMLTGNLLISLNNELQKCQPGTIVDFTNIKIKNRSGQTSLIEDVGFALY